MKFTIITLFPEMFGRVLNTSMLWKAQEKHLAEFELVDLRPFGIGPRRQVDDAPYGGGDGMLMRPEPLFAAIESVKSKDPAAETILMTPRGQLWSQSLARQFADTQSVGQNPQTIGLGGVSKRGVHAPTSSPGAVPATREDGLAHETSAKSDSLRVLRHYILICPHYEGYDERILTLIDHQISIGHYILTGGELPAMIVLDSIVRLIPGVLGGETSAAIESFSEDTNLEYPQYTRPEIFRGQKVPDILLSGNHGEIARWRESHSGTI